MMLLGMVGSALAFGAFLAHFSEIRLIQVIQGTAVVTMLLNGAALWKQEARDPSRTAAGPRAARASGNPGQTFSHGRRTRRSLVALGARHGRLQHAGHPASSPMAGRSCI